MKKLFTLLAAVVFTACGTTVRQAEITDVESQNLIGAVKSVSQTSMSAMMDDSGTLAPIDTLGTNRDTFNREGYVIETEYLDKTGKVMTRTVMEYNDKNQRISSRSDHNPEGFQDSAQPVTPNTYEYDKAGFMTAQYVRDTAGNVTGKTTYRNNEQGLPVETNHYDGPEMKRSSTIITKYDAKKRPTFESTVMSGMMSSYSFTYDGDSRNPSVITANMINQDERQTITIHQEYSKHDEYGNWTECINHVIEAGQYGIITREINYYE